MAEKTARRPAALVCADCGFANAVEIAECEACGASLYRSPVAAPVRRDDDQLLSDLADVLPPRSPLLVEAGTSVADAIALMRETGSGYVLVVAGGRIGGIFTERDLLGRVVAAGHAPRTVAIEQVMTRDPVVLRHDDSVAVAIHKMVLGSFRHIPLVDADGRIERVVSAHEILVHLNRLLQLPRQGQ